MLDDDTRVVMVGINEKEEKLLPSNIIGVRRTESAQKLAEIYTASDVFFNPTYEDNYPTVNLEAEACGTPVITYDVGGAKETLHDSRSLAIPVGNLEGALLEIKRLCDL